MYKTLSAGQKDAVLVELPLQVGIKAVACLFNIFRNIRPVAYILHKVYYIYFTLPRTVNDFTRLFPGFYRFFRYPIKIPPGFFRFFFLPNVLKFVAETFLLPKKSNSILRIV
jgi:hypothetical protein